MPNEFFVLAPTTVFGEHIDLRDRLPRRNRNVLYVSQRSEVVKQVCRIKVADSRQFLENFLLAVSIRAVQLLAPFVDVRQYVRRLHEKPCAAIDLLHVLVGVACRDIRFAAILIWICEQVITIPALLRGQAEFIRTRSGSPALGCLGITGLRDCVQLT